MAALALILYVVFLFGAFGLRVVLHRGMTGASGINGVLRGRPGSAMWWAGVALVLSILLSIAAPIAQLAGLDPVSALVTPSIQIIGIVLAVLGFLATVVAQHIMGPSWRVGVNPDETTGLVTAGAFNLVRNPVFTSTVVSFLGLTLMAPNIIALVAFVGVLISVELQVRVVEEPYLRQIHGATYIEYGRKVGRFLPGIGRFRNR
ncbi:isoprenylcysteine carboxylmethyltransferase family protein [Kibdelosporangium philippinense]|uniref:Isoprenylcysteine carboxylmethyltransferase family protein n=1 Tax=Kibdelosporangium philippinense TaxID=211113 RepID=A0ABS8Z5B5_9PSEU|nr:isoprenylcysteine carboxylmethyltransferase family protein [Kibdelosporangium philippinense]MCE7002617.1 isoprenylcysteine carboxylmethyltransferase family protein [Kibdelosporangium philippinense]